MPEGSDPNASSPFQSHSWLAGVPWREHVPLLLLGVAILAGGFFVFRQLGDGGATTAVEPAPLPTVTSTEPVASSSHSAPPDSADTTADPARTEEPLLSEADLFVSLNALLESSPIEFETNTTTLGAEAELVLDAVAQLLIDSPEARIEVAGHTDSRGGEALNAALSLGRAVAVVEALQARGVTAELVAKGYGATDPVISPEVSLDDQRKNRRIEFKLS